MGEGENVVGNNKPGKPGLESLFNFSMCPGLLKSSFNSYPTSLCMHENDVQIRDSNACCFSVVTVVRFECGLVFQKS